jgi:hypothetical protein
MKIIRHYTNMINMWMHSTKNSMEKGKNVHFNNNKKILRNVWT